MALKTLQEFVNEVKGKYPYEAGISGFNSSINPQECVTLIKAYAHECFSHSFTASSSFGNGRYVWSKNALSKYCDKIEAKDISANGGYKAGDIISCSSSSAPEYGHVVIALNDSTTKNGLRYMHQYRGTRATIQTGLRSTVYGLLRPKTNMGAVIDSSSNSPTIKTDYTPISSSSNSGKLFYYNQRDYSNINYGAGSIARRGCGICSSLMAINTLAQKEIVTVKELTDYAIKNKVHENLSIPKLFSAIERNKGLGLDASYKHTYDYKEVHELLDKGYLVVCHIGASGGNLGSKGHYMCIYGHKKGRFIVADPNIRVKNYYENNSHMTPIKIEGKIVGINVKDTYLHSDLKGYGYSCIKLRGYSTYTDFLGNSLGATGEGYESEDTSRTISYQNWTGEVTIKKDFTNLLWYLDGTETPTDWGFRGMQGETMKLIGKIGNEYFYGRVYGICQSSVLCVVPCNAVNGKGKKGKGTGTITIGGARLNSNGSETIDTSYVGRTKYNLTNAQIDDLAHICVREQGSGNLKAIAAEASIMANIFEYKRWAKATKYSDLYNYVLYGGWFGKNGGTINNSDYKPSKEELAIVKDVLINGNRTIPLYVNEHDWVSDIQLFNGQDTGLRKGQGIKYRGSHTPNYLKDHSNYISGQTRIKNVFGFTWTFYTFFTDSKSADPFGYTDGWYKHVMEMAKKEEKKQSSTGSNRTIVDNTIAGSGTPSTKNWIIKYTGSNLRVDTDGPISQSYGDDKYHRNSTSVQYNNGKSLAPDKIPYLVAKSSNDYRKLGLVLDTKNNTYTYAIVGDGNPSKGWGEVSLKTGWNLGHSETWGNMDATNGIFKIYIYNKKIDLSNCKNATDVNKAIMEAVNKINK